MQFITLFLLIGYLSIAIANFDAVNEIYYQLVSFLENEETCILSNGRTLTLLECLGCSPESLVWKAYFDDKDVAVKVFTNESYMDREVAAYRALDAINQTEVEQFGIPTLYYVGTIFETYKIIVITLFDNNLYDLWRAQNMNFEIYTTLQVFLQSVKALRYIHSKNIVHNNIRPQNIFFRGDRVFVGDFDLATLNGGKSESSPGIFSSRALWAERNGTAMDDLESLVFTIWSIQANYPDEPAGLLMNRLAMLPNKNVKFVMEKCEHFRKFPKAYEACKFICKDEMLSGKSDPDYHKIIGHLKAAITETGQRQFERLPSSSASSSESISNYPK